MARDLRDPQEIGRFLQHYVHVYPQGHILEAANELPHLEIRNYSAHDTIGTRSAEDYRLELEARDDKYAKRRLSELNGTKRYGT